MTRHTHAGDVIGARGVGIRDSVWQVVDDGIRDVGWGAGDASCPYCFGPITGPSPPTKAALHGEM